MTPPGSGLTNAGCNGSDVGLLDAMEEQYVNKNVNGINGDTDDDRQPHRHAGHADPGSRTALR